MILFYLISAHFLCDYPLQGDFIGKWKNRHAHKGNTLPDIMPTRGIPLEIKPQAMKSPYIPWWHLMTAHAFIHAGAVLLITNNLSLALIELGAHYIIDVLKCEGWTDINVDQALHILCKIGYFYYLP